MHITINDSLYLDSKGHGYRLRKPGSTRIVSNFSSLPGVASYLVAKGAILPEGVQLGWAVSNLCTDLAHGFAAVCGSHAAAVEGKAVITFGVGRFKLIPNGPGGYWLVNPMKDVPLLKDAFKGQRIIVGYPGSVRQGLQLAVDRVLQGQTREIPYTTLNTAFLDLARGLMGDVVVTLGNGEVHAVTPRPAMAIPTPPTAEEKARNDARDKERQAEQDRRIAGAVERDTLKRQRAWCKKRSA